MKCRLQEWLLLFRFALARFRFIFFQNWDVKRHEHFMHSVKVAFPQMPIREIKKLCARHRMSMYKFNVLKQHLSQLTSKELQYFLDRYVDVNDMALLEQIGKSETPVIFVTPHYGSFSLGCLKVIAEIGHQKTVNAFYNPPSINQSSEGFKELFQRLGYGFNALFNDDTAVLKAMRVLRRGEALTMMPDVFDMEGRVLYVPFFKRLVPAMAGTALFAIKSRATVIVGYSCPSAGLKSTLQLGKPLEYACTGDLESDIASLTATIFRQIEEQIRHNPEHWNYLQNFGDLLKGRVSLEQRIPEDWLSNLETLKPQLQIVLPEWGDTLREIHALQANAELTLNLN